MKKKPTKDSKPKVKITDENLDAINEVLDWASISAQKDLAAYRAGKITMRELRRRFVDRGPELDRRLAEAEGSEPKPKRRSTGDPGKPGKGDARA